MCTAACYKTEGAYLGRTLDYEFSYGEQVTLTPRNFPLSFGDAGTKNSHYAILGMAHVAGGYPLYYDAMNEKGLGMAGLNFVGNARYADESVPGKDNVPQYALIPWVLSQCATLAEARALLARLNLTGTPFSPQLPTAQLHWILADASGAITVESTAEGLQVYDNPAGVLTNNPPFPYQMFQLNNYRHLTRDNPANTFGLPLTAYSRGLGGMGLPGDLSSQSRFIRAAFTVANSLSEPDENASVCQFFHILGSVDQTRGLCRLPNGTCEITIYTGCMSLAQGIYYYTTYNNRTVTAVDMHRENLDGSSLSCRALKDSWSVTFEN